MTAREQRIVANDYYCRAMQMFEDHQAGLTEFVREEEVFDYQDRWLSTHKTLKQAKQSIK